MIKWETTFKHILKLNQKLGQVCLILSSALEGDREACSYEGYYDSFSDVQPDLSLAHNLIVSTSSTNCSHKFPLTKIHLPDFTCYKNGPRHLNGG